MRVLLAIWMLLFAAPAWAHKPSDSYLTLAMSDTHIEGQRDIALRDLNDAIGLDDDGNCLVSPYPLRPTRARQRHWSNSLTITQTEPIQFCDFVRIAMT